MVTGTLYNRYSKRILDNLEWKLANTPHLFWSGPYPTSHTIKELTKLATYFKFHLLYKAEIQVPELSWFQYWIKIKEMYDTKCILKQ